MDTIYALSSGRLPSGVAIIRISGPQVRFSIETICRKSLEPRQMALSQFIDTDGSVIDRGLACFFAGPHSFTGEDCAEFHVHGSVAVVRALLARLSKLIDMRAADAGEFTKRAFLNGKIDLTSAEGLSDLLAAETEAQRRLAISQSEGGLKGLYDGWRQKLIHLRAMVEAAIDFSDEDDVAVRAMKSVRTDVEHLISSMQAHIGHYRSTEIIQDGFRVVIIGAPNAGKSSLLNAFAGREVAIATEEAGTTRDLIDVRLELNGNLVILTDTAGIRDGAGSVEQIGITRALARAHSADLVLVCEDICAPVSITNDFPNVALLRVGLQIDRLAGNSGSASHRYDVLLSAMTGFGMDSLIELVSNLANDATAAASLAPGRERQVDLLRDSVVSLQSILLFQDHELDLTGELLRRATESLGRITGSVNVEDLLDVIFSQFCVGK